MRSPASISYRRKTKYLGVYFRHSAKRRFEGKPDICFDIGYHIQGKLVWEKVGLASEGFTAKRASDIRMERLVALRLEFEAPALPQALLVPPPPPPKDPLFKDVAAMFLEWSKSNINRKGIEDQSRYRQHLAHRFDRKRLSEISSSSSASGGHGPARPSSRLSRNTSRP